MGPSIGGETCNWRSYLWLEVSPLLGALNQLGTSTTDVVVCHTPWLPWLCVNASVHVFMSTWLPMSAPLTMHSLMETWVPVCGIVCLSQSPYFWTHTLVRMCTCISICIYVHQFRSAPLPVHSFAPPPLHSYIAGCSCMTVLWLCPSHLTSVPTPWLECVYASVYVFMSTSLLHV